MTAAPFRADRKMHELTLNSNINALRKKNQNRRLCPTCSSRLLYSFFDPFGIYSRPSR